MDGTSNKPHLKRCKINKNTNVSKLYSLDTGSTVKYYIEGVGANKKILGMITGWGIKRRSVETYLFIAHNYKEGDTLNIFGFSRGAFNARIVSNMIYVFGIADLSKLDSSDHKKIIRKLYRKYKGKNLSVSERRKEVDSFVSKWNKKHSKKGELIAIDTNNKTRIDLLGLWDTVEAFGWPDLEENFTAPNKWHLNQLSNINKAYHAVALDDNRARIYTPILLTSNEILKTIDPSKQHVVNEVWFNGSHADVGGGHKKLPDLRNNSLLWMKSRIEIQHLYTTDSTLTTYPYSSIHNMQTFWFRFITKRRIRSIVTYYQTNNSYNNGKLNIHESVILRMKEGLIPEFKITNKPYKVWYDKWGLQMITHFWRKPYYDWYDTYPFKDCFQKVGSKRIYKSDCGCINVVN